MRRSHVRLTPLVALATMIAAAPVCAANDPGEEEAALAVADGDEAGSSGLRELTTDRPDVTESPFTVDAGHIQIETTLFGYTRSRRDANGVVTDGYEFATSNLRVGVSDNFELDLVWQPYGIADPRGGAAGATERGIGSIDLRAKLNLWGNDGLARPGDTALALLPYVTIPTDGENGIGAENVEFGLIVPLAIELGGGFGLGLNGAVQFARPDDGARTYDASLLTSASLAFDLAPGLGGYAEVVWEFSRGDPEGDIVTLDTGLTYALGENWQLDAGINIGATDAADAIAPFIGLTARF